mgnify:CR=1 FL=1
MYDRGWQADETTNKYSAESRGETALGALGSTHGDQSNGGVGNADSGEGPARTSEIENTKFCFVCKIEKSFADFEKMHSGKLRTKCKKCRSNEAMVRGKIRRQDVLLWEHEKAWARERNKQKRLENSEAVSKAKRIIYLRAKERNPEGMREKSREQSRKRLQDNPEKYRGYSTPYAAA